MQPISGTPPRPPGEGPVTPNTPGEQPLSTQQRTVLERLITRLIALTSQQNAEVWAALSTIWASETMRRYSRAISLPPNKT